MWSSPACGSHTGWCNSMTEMLKVQGGKLADLCQEDLVPGHICCKLHTLTGTCLVERRACLRPALRRGTHVHV